MRTGRQGPRKKRDRRKRMLTKEELDQINRFSKAELTADQVYTFSVRLCDNA